jgi:hypothetical protein
MTQFCSKCHRRKVIDYHVEPEEAWRLVVLNRWPVGRVCASCFDVEADRAKVRYALVNVTGTSWSDQARSRNPLKRKQ